MSPIAHDHTFRRSRPSYGREAYVGVMDRGAEWMARPGLPSTVRYSTPSAASPRLLGVNWVARTDVALLLASRCGAKTGVFVLKLPN